MTGIYIETPEFTVIDFTADKETSTITVEYHELIEDRIETFLGPIMSTVDVEAILNIEYDNSQIEDDRIMLSTNDAEILNAVTKVRALEPIDEDLYEEVVSDINHAMIQRLRQIRFEMRIDKDE